ncbi:MAG TPA: carboxypeptidase-like regulatory domain-containing protein, partial [Chitinophagaceae bacterium]|nr:carboxypeptidase-like regulatory domain-containing protein [Chitinophagaceae bacterium]
MKKELITEHAKRYWRKYMFVWLVMTGVLLPGAYGQQPGLKDIKGTVINGNGGGLEGVTVKLKGTAIATATAKDGAFVIKVPAGDAKQILVFSHVGFETREMEAGNNTSMTIILTETSGTLNDVVVIGYGTV